MAAASYLSALKMAKRYDELNRIQARVTDMLGRDLMPKPGTSSDIETGLIRRAADGHAEVSQRRCCECRHPFVIVRTERVAVDLCLSCRSLWLDAGELRAFTHAVGAEVPGAKFRTKPSSYQCPVCDATLETCQYKVPHAVMIDICPKGCGMYFEHGEFTRVLDIES
ncbi:MAG: zf-TFIIB domain-containing protein [Planctomycetota bacterium]|jgi:Zn-finger nucleic acid-binding protein|nr:zf-TFIIB domain-containing protein [Planctomycetota bacterium]